MDNAPLNFHLDLTAERYESDDTLRARAKENVDAALIKLGEALAIRTWDKIANAFGSPDTNMAAFLRQARSDFLDNVTPAEKQLVEEEIFQRLLRLRDTWLPELEE